MKSITFSPKQRNPESQDGIASSLYKVAQYFFVIGLGVLPIFFVPTAVAPFDYSKTLLVLGVLLLAVIFYSFSVLRSGVLNLQFTTPVLVFWGVVIATSLSGLFAAHVTDAFIGTHMSIQTVVFISIMALIITVSQVLLREKTIIMHLYLLLFGSAVVLAIYHLVRLLFGADTWRFGLSLSETFSPLGSWNDLGIFFGLILILALLVLEQLPLPRIGRALFLMLGLLSLGILAVVQFIGVWVLVGIVALITLMYSLTRHRFDSSFHEASSASIVMAAVISVCALFFFIASGTAGNLIDRAVGINYLEVRPSPAATLDIATAIYTDNALLGIGPNHFDDAWRLHKNPSINDSVFWGTDFSAGNGYLTTIFSTTGILGTALWLIFFGSFLFVGYRMLIHSEIRDHFWYFIGSSAFIAAVYLWIITSFYVPGSTILLLASLCTGVALVSYTNLRTIPVLHFSTLENTRATIILVAGVLFVVIGSVSILYQTTNHYVAAYTFNQANAALQQNDLERSNQLLQAAYQLNPSHEIARQRARNATLDMNQLFAVNDPSDDEQEQFQNVLANGIAAAQQAVLGNPHDSRNWAVQASVYNAVIDADIPEARTRGLAAVQEAQRLNPHNPELYALEAQILFRSDDAEGAREAIQTALDRKSNYVPALNLLTELEIVSDNLAEAQASVRSIIRLEPDNPGRYYQLAILLLADEQQDIAVQALERAIELDNDFANARYVLALQYSELGRIDDAISQLEYVRSLNPENESVDVLIEQLSSGEPISEEFINQAGVAESIPQTENGAVQGSGDPDSDLLSPVNASGDTRNDEEAPATTEVIEAPQSTSDDESEANSSATTTETE